MTTRRLRLGLFVCLALGLPAAVLAETQGEVSLFVGQKQLDLDAPSEVEDAERHDELGVTFSFGDVDWPVMLAVDVLQSSGKASADVYQYSYTYGAYTVTTNYNLSYDFETLEVDIGVRKFWRQEKKFVPYVGGGAAIVYLKADNVLTATVVATGPLGTFPGPTDSIEVLGGDDVQVGYWVEAGLQWRLSSKFSLGLDARWSDAKVTLSSGQDVFNLFDVVADSQLKAGGAHVGLTGGFRW